MICILYDLFLFPHTCSDIVAEYLTYITFSHKYRIGIIHDLTATNNEIVVLYTCKSKVFWSKQVKIFYSDCTTRREKYLMDPALVRSHSQVMVYEGTTLMTIHKSQYGTMYYNSMSNDKLYFNSPYITQCSEHAIYKLDYVKSEHKYTYIISYKCKYMILDDDDIYGICDNKLIIFGHQREAQFITFDGYELLTLYPFNKDVYIICAKKEDIWLVVWNTYVMYEMRLTNIRIRNKCKIAVNNKWIVLSEDGSKKLYFYKNMLSKN